MIHSINENYNELTYYTLGLQDKCFIHQYVVDAYSSQTADLNTKSISLIFALVGLYLHIEKNKTGKEVQEFHTLMSKNKIKWPKLILPSNRGEISIEMVLKKNAGEERNQMINKWCVSIWNAYYENHSKIKEISEYYQKLK
jgi:Family of unknown function (DUF5946)